MDVYLHTVSSDQIEVPAVANCEPTIKFVSEVDIKHNNFTTSACVMDVPGAQKPSVNQPSTVTKKTAKFAATAKK